MKTTYATDLRISTLRLAALVILAFFSTLSWGQIAAWQFGTPATIGDELSASATTYNQYIQQPLLSRGLGLTARGLARGFSSGAWNTSSPTAAEAATKNEYYEFTIQTIPHYHVSLSSLKARLRRSDNGPDTYKWQYSFNNDLFTDMGSGTLSSAIDEGGDQATIDLSKFPKLQNVGSDTIIYIRLLAWGASTTDGTFAFGRTPQYTTTNSLEIGGTVKAGPNKECVLNTLAPASIQANSAYGYGKITDLGFPNPIHYGMCWSTVANPTILNNKNDNGNAMVLGQFMSCMTNLKPSTTYYVRAYATNAWGTSYGNQQIFTTTPTNQGPSNEYIIKFTGSGDNATVDQVLVENLTQAKSITIGGTTELYLNPNGVTPPIPTNLATIKESATSNVIIYPNPASETSTLSFNLTEAGAVNLTICDVSGKRVSNFSDFMTAGAYKFKLPAFKSGIYFVTLVTNDRRVTEKLISVSNGLGNYNSIQNTEKIELVESEKVQPQKVAAVINPIAGLAYNDGDQLRITGTGARCKTIIMDSPTRSKTIDIKFIKCIDGDNNAYAVVKVGPVYWMAENMKATKKADGTSITKVSNQTAWAGLTSTSDAYCYLGDVDANATTYGGLYTYHAATTLAPAGGWRLPNKGDIHQMASYIDGRLTAGSKLKEKGSSHWTSDNVFATNETGFNAVPAGIRTASAFSPTGTTAAYWTETSVDDQNAAIAKITSKNDSLEIYSDTLKTVGLSVRYVYDVPDTRVAMMKCMFGSLADSQGAAVTGLPLPNKTVLMAPDKELFFTGRHDTSLSPQLRFLDNPAATSAPYIGGLPTIASGGVKWWQNPKKVTVMTNENGRESTVIAVWNETVTGPSYGTKKITLHIISDESAGYAHQSVVLADDFTVPNIAASGTGYNGKTLTSYDVAEAWQWEMTLRTGDINSDGTPDIIIGVHDLLRVYDGKTFAKISERNFHSDFYESGNYAFFLRTEVADMDKDGKNDIMVMTSTPSNFFMKNADDSKSPYFRIYKEGNLALKPDSIRFNYQFLNQVANTSTNTITNTNSGDCHLNHAYCANFSAGDVNNDGFPEVVMAYTYLDNIDNLPSDKTATKSVAYFSCSKSQITNKFEFKNINGKLTKVKSQELLNYSLLPSIVLARLKGPASPNYIIAGDYVFYVDEVTKDLVILNQSPAVDTDNSIFLSRSPQAAVFGDQIVAGNFDKDPSSREMLYSIIHTTLSGIRLEGTLVVVNVKLDINTNELIGSTSMPYFNESGSNLLSNQSFPVIAAVNTKHTGRLLEYQRHSYLLTKPVINAVLAAAPFYKGWCSTQNSPSTTWGKSTSTGTSTESEVTHTASLIAGFEHDIEIPVIGVKIGGVEFTAKASYGFSSAFKTERTTTISQQFVGYDQNMVVLTSTPYDAYYYKIMKSENPKEIGSEVMFGFPRISNTMVLPVYQYNEWTEGQNVPKIDQSIFNHTIGYPFTYPSAEGLSNLPVGEKFEKYSNDGIGVGYVGGTGASIIIDTNTTTTESLSTEFDFEFVATLADVKMGSGYGYSKTYKNSTTIGKSTTVGAYVPSLLLDRPAEIKSYNWKIAWYNYQKSGNRFQVVNYIVK